jgi:DNA-binding response OmpR family regulator
VQQLTTLAQSPPAIAPTAAGPTAVRRRTPDRPMKILVAADAAWVRNQVRASLVTPGLQVIEVTRGQDVRGMVAEHEPDLVVLDLQIGNMGGIAVAMDLRLEESAGRLPHMVIMLLLDREADRFLAKRASVDAALLKPFDSGTLGRAVRRVVSRGGTRLRRAA